MRTTSPQEMEAVLRLDGPARYEHFVKRVADSGIVWGLWDDGWALMETGEGARVFPLWPAPEYADAARGDNWADYEPSAIEVRELLDEFLPDFVANGIVPGVFPTPGGKGVTPTVDELERALREELAKYGE